MRQARRLVVQRNLTGTVSRWDAEGRFGFITADGDGDPVFFKRRAWRGKKRMPQVGEAVRFHLDGRDMAVNIRRVGPIPMHGATGQ